MRGRTNVGGGGISLNANLVDKEIKSGNIIAGDFVEYYSESTYIEQTQNVNFVFAIGDYDIAQIGSALTAFSNGKQKFSYTGYNCSYVGKYNDFIVFHDTRVGILGVLSVSSNGFVLVDSVSTGATYGSYATCIWGGGGKICCFGNQRYCYVVDIDNNGNLSNYKQTTFSSAISQTAQYMCYYNNKFYIIASSSSTAYSYPLNIDAENNVTLGTSIFLSYYQTNREVFRKNDIIIFAYNEADSNDVRKIYGKLNVVNFVTGNTFPKTLPSHGEMLTYINNSLCLITGKETLKPAWDSSNDNYIENSLKLCRFDEQTYELTTLDEIKFDDDYKTYPGIGEHFYNLYIKQVSKNVGICDLYIAYAQCKKQTKFVVTERSTSKTDIEDYNLYLYDIEYNTLKDFSDKNYVIPYQDDGHPIGVAKDSGSTGDTIGVYVPVSS